MTKQTTLSILLATLSVLIGIVFYPISLYPVMPFTNGGPIGLITLLLAVFCAWASFFLNKQLKWLRWTIQAGLVIIVTFGLFREIMNQWLSGWRNW